MSSPSHKPEQQLLLAFVLILVAISLSVSLLLPRTIGVAEAKHRAQMKRAAAEEHRTGVEGAGGVAAPLGVHPASKEEQLAFLRELERIGAATGVELVSYQPSEDPEAEERDAHSPLIPRVVEMTVAGSYGELIAFFHTLTHVDRFYGVKTLRVTEAGYPRLTATFLLVRYVTIPCAEGG